MAPTFKHSKGTVVLIDQLNMSAYLQSAKVSVDVQAADVTCFPDADKKYIPGLRNAVIAMDGLFSFRRTTAAGSTDIDNEFEQALGGSTKRVVTVGPAGDTVGDRTWMMLTDDTKYDVHAPAHDVVQCSVEMQASSGYQGGRWLRGISAAARTTTGSGAAVLAPGTTAAGGTAGGGVAHLHVIAASTVTTGYTIKVQHSTSGSTWVDLITFALTTADGGRFARSTVAGTIKEQVRETNSAFTGGAAKSLTYAVSFARRGTIQ